MLELFFRHYQKENKNLESKSDDIIILKEEILEDLEETSRDELFERALCQESGMVCCFNENIL